MPSPDVELVCKSLDDLRRVAGVAAERGAMQSAVDDCPNPVLVSDHNARIVMVNGLAGRLLGTSTRDLQALTIWDITHWTHEADFDVLWREFLRAGRQRGHYGLRHHNGTVVNVAYCAIVNAWPNTCLFVLRALQIPS